MNEIVGEWGRGKQPRTEIMDDEHVLCMFVRTERQAGGSHIGAETPKCIKWWEHSKRNDGYI